MVKTSVKYTCDRCGKETEFCADGSGEYKKMLEMLYPEIYHKSYRICGLKDFFLIGIPIKFFFSVDNNENSVLYLLRKKSRFYALVAFLSFQGFIITCFILLIIIEF